MAASKGTLVLQEENERWVRIMQFLIDNGARSGKGCRMRQDLIAEKIGCNPRTLHEYLSKMEEHGVLKIRRTTVDGSFGSPRGFNIYFVTCTVVHWEKVLGPAVVGEIKRRRHLKRSAISRNAAAERKRLRLQKQLEEMGAPAGFKTPRGPRADAPPAPQKMADEDAVLLAGAFDGLVDEELVGW